jgi:hypothetical protein
MDSNSDSLYSDPPLIQLGNNPMPNLLWLIVTLLLLSSCRAAVVVDSRSTRTQPDTDMGLYSPSQHALYDGRFKLLGQNIYHAGSLNDSSPWDHMDNEARNLRSVDGEIHIDVNEISNTGEFWAEMQLPEGRYRVELELFNEFSPCQDGGIAAYLFEHGNAGCGDANWPKSFLFVAGWGFGKATLNGQPLYEDYEIHFMVTQGMRDRESLQVQLNPDSGEAGSINPAMQQLDFFIRSPTRNESNYPNREVFDHFFAMDVMWRN